MGADAGGPGGMGNDQNETKIAYEQSAFSAVLNLPNSTVMDA